MKTRTKIKERNRDLQDSLEIENMLLTAESVIEAALIRKESRGLIVELIIQKWLKNGKKIFLLRK